MAMEAELREVFPYFPMPNYPWARMTANFIHTMRREREVYMEGAARVAEGDGDVEMESPDEVVVPEERSEEVEMGQRDEVFAETVVPSEVLPQALEGVPRRPRVTKTYSKKTTGTTTAETKDLPSAELTRPQKVILHVRSPVPPASPSSAGPPVPPSPSPSGGDHSSDRDYLEEHPSHIWVNASRSRRKLRIDRYRLDDGAVRVRPVRAADTALARVVNLNAYARGQAPRFTRGIGVRASDILFVSLGSRGIFLWTSHILFIL